MAGLRHQRILTCGLALQQAFGWLVGLPEERIAKRPNNMEICFEEPDFDGFLKRLERFPGIDRLGTVTEQGWGQRVSASTTRTDISSKSAKR